VKLGTALFRSEILLSPLTFPKIQTEIIPVRLEKFYSKNFETLTNTNEPLIEQIFGHFFPVKVHLR